MLAQLASAQARSSDTAAYTTELSARWSRKRRNPTVRPRRGFAATAATSRLKLRSSSATRSAGSTAREIEQVASEGRWTRDGRYELHIVGYRSQNIGVPYSTLSIVRAWTVPSLYGERLSLGAYFAMTQPTRHHRRGASVRRRPGALLQVFGWRYRHRPARRVAQRSDRASSRPAGRSRRHALGRVRRRDRSRRRSASDRANARAIPHGRRRESARRSLRTSDGRCRGRVCRVRQRGGRRQILAARVAAHRVSGRASRSLGQARPVFRHRVEHRRHRRQRLVERRRRIPPRLAA